MSIYSKKPTYEIPKMVEIPEILVFTNEYE